MLPRRSIELPCERTLGIARGKLVGTNRTWLRWHLAATFCSSTLDCVRTKSARARCVRREVYVTRSALRYTWRLRTSNWALVSRCRYLCWLWALLPTSCSTQFSLKPLAWLLKQTWCHFSGSTCNCTVVRTTVR